MFERARSNAARIDEPIHLVTLEPDDTAEPICGQLPLIYEAVERTGGDAQSTCRIRRAQPLDFILTTATSVSADLFVAGFICLRTWSHEYILGRSRQVFTCFVVICISLHLILLNVILISLSDM